MFLDFNQYYLLVTPEQEKPLLLKITYNKQKLIKLLIEQYLSTLLPPLIAYKGVLKQW
jgi:prophage maintenance system killer protein